MKRFSVLFGLLTLGLSLLVSVGGTADTKKETKKEGDKVIKGFIPDGWKALKLSKEQSKKVQMIDVEYKTKIADLNKKIDELKVQSRLEMIKQLNDDQKALLAKLSGVEPKEKEKEKSKEKDK